MALWQYELCFGTQYSDRGWREMVCWSGSGTSPFDDRGAWITQRRAFLASDTYIFAYTRRQIDGIAKASQTIKEPQVYFGQAGLPANVSGDCIDYNAWSNGLTNRRTFTFRGVPDAWVQSDNITNLGLDGLALIQVYMSWLINSNAAIRINNPENTWNPIVGVGPSGEGQGVPIQISTNLGAAADIDFGDVIQIRGLHGYPYLNGRWIGAPVTTSSFNLVSSGRYYAVANGIGEWNVFDASSAAIVTYSFGVAATRDTGRRPFSPRGRQSKKILHR